MKRPLLLTGRAIERHLAQLRDDHYTQSVRIEAWRSFSSRVYVVCMDDPDTKKEIVLGRGSTIREAMREAVNRPRPDSEQAKVAQAEACVALCKDLAGYTGARDSTLNGFAQRARRAWHTVPDLAPKPEREPGTFDLKAAFESQERRARHGS